jgi:hypothetical protein
VEEDVYKPTHRGDARKFERFLSCCSGSKGVVLDDSGEVSGVDSAGRFDLLKVPLLVPADEGLVECLVHREDDFQKNRKTEALSCNVLRNMVPVMRSVPKVGASW